MKWVLIMFVMWGYGLSEPATGVYKDEAACIKAAMSIFDRVQASSQTMNRPLVVWGCAPEATAQ